MAVDKYIPLIDELITRNPVAVRYNVVRLGLGDERFMLSRQSLMGAISEWQKKNNANEREVAIMIREVLSVETAINQAVQDLTNQKPQIELPNWAYYVVFFLIVLGFLAAIGGVVKLLKKLFS